MTQEEIGSEVYGVFAVRPSSKDHSSDHEWARRRREYEDFCEQFCGRLRREDGNVVYEALFSLACSRWDPFHTPISLAADLLLYVNPLCPVSCQEAVRAVSVSDWDPSEEEVVWYLTGHFGPGMVYEALDALEHKDYIQEARARVAAWHEAHPSLTLRDVLQVPPYEKAARLDSVRYWLDILVREPDARSKWEPGWWCDR